jgi:hypothetical protein
VKPSNSKDYCKQQQRCLQTKIASVHSSLMHRPTTSRLQSTFMARFSPPEFDWSPADDKIVQHNANP